MKLNTIIATVALGGLALVSCNKETTETTSEPSPPTTEAPASPAGNANVQTVSLKVTGMT